MNHAEEAKRLFMAGCNCAQAVFCAFCDETGLDTDTAARMASSFGGGMGRLREVCGTVSGALLALGMLRGYADPKDPEAKKAHYRLVQEYARRFREKNGTIVCRELLKNVPVTPGDTPETRTPEFYARRPCLRLAGEAAAILDALLAETRPEQSGRHCETDNASMPSHEKTAGGLPAGNGEKMRTILNFAALDTSLTLWWEQPEDAPRNAVYTVLLDGKPVAEVNRTHATLNQLRPETKYDVQVCLGDELIAETTAKTTAAREAVDVTQPPYCAVGDGRTMNTKSLQAAIDDCGPGQEVFFPAGVYLTGALRLHSDMAVHLEKDAVLRGTENPEDYLPKIESRFEGVHQQCYQSLLNLGSLHADAGPNCRNVLIYGDGTICGGGQPLALNVIEREKELLKDQLAALGDKIKEYENDHTIPGRARGRLINLSNCENVRITGLTLQNGASWNVHMVYSRNIVTDHCVFRSEGVWNGDGWDPDSSEDCTLFASEFHTGDDSVAIKSGKNPEGNVINRPTRRIRIFDCVSEYGLGIAIGSEMSGGVEDVRIWDCDLRHSLYGVQIKATRKRGGYVKNVSVRDCALSRFLVTAVLYNDDGEGAKEPPVFERFRCDRVFFTGWARDYWEKEDHAVPAIQLSGFPVPGHEVRDAVFRACVSENDAQIRLQDCRNVAIEIERADSGKN